jgi:hypothetical protein
MVVETAFVVQQDDFRVRLLIDNKHKDKRRAFITLLKNIFAGREPFESPNKKRLSKAHKKKKKQKKIAAQK